MPSLVNNYRVALYNIHWKEGKKIIKRRKIRSRRYPLVYPPDPLEDPLKNKMNSLDLGKIRETRFEIVVDFVPTNNRPRTVSKTFPTSKS